MNPLLRSVPLLLLILFSFSCDQSTDPSNSAGPQLTASETNLTIASSFTRTVSISGGKGRYFIKSNSDSSVVSVNFPPEGLTNNSGIQYAVFLGLKIGSATVIIQDSAKSAEVKISVSVAAMASSPASVEVRVGRAAFVTVQGGTMPMSIVSAPNPAYVEVELNTSGSFYVNGRAEGSTSITLKDNANPAHTVTIPITIVPQPKFTASGKISFTSGAGIFDVNGISATNIMTASANSEGAGGWRYLYSWRGDMINVTGYKKKTANIIDVVSILYFSGPGSPGTIPIDSGMFGMENTASVMFAFDGDLNASEADVYVMTTGNLSVNAMNAQSSKGTFYGSAVLTRGEIVNPAFTATVSNGAFEVPLITDYLSVPRMSVKDQRLENFLEKIRSSAERRIRESGTKIR